MLYHYQYVSSAPYVAKSNLIFGLNSDRMDKQVLLSSQGTVSTSQYAVGLLRDGKYFICLSSFKLFVLIQLVMQ